MTDRRPLSAGISTLPNIDPDIARAFVTQEPKANPAAERLTAVARSERTVNDRPRPSVTEPIRKPAKKSKSHGVTPVGLIPVTVRLRPEVAGGLKRASLERQLAGEQPFTQQDLIEQLLEPWLRETGFLA
jgi:hypothetical protein